MEIGVGSSMTSISFRRANTQHSATHYHVRHRMFVTTVIRIITFDRCSNCRDWKIGTISTTTHNTNQMLSVMRTCMKFDKRCATAIVLIAREDMAGPETRIGGVHTEKQYGFDINEITYPVAVTHRVSKVGIETEKKNVWVRDRLRTACHISRVAIAANQNTTHIVHPCGARETTSKIE